MARSGSAGTLDVTIGAQTGPLAQGMAQGEQIVRRFRRAVDSEAGAVGLASSRMSQGFSMRTGEIGKAARAGAAGLAILANVAGDAAGDVGRLAGGIATGFASGGPVGAAIGGAIEGFSFLAKAIGKSREQAAALRAEAARIEVKNLVAYADAVKRSVEERSSRFMGDMARQGELAFDASQVGLSPAEQRRRSQQRAVDEERSKYGPLSASALEGLQRAQNAAEERARAAKETEDATRRLREAEEAVSKSLSERERTLRTETRLGEDRAKWARDYMQIEDLVASGHAAEAERLRALVVEEQRRAKAAEDRASAERSASATSSFSDESRRRMEDLAATTEKERLLLRQRREIQAAVDANVSAAAIESRRVVHAKELADLAARERSEVEGLAYARRQAADAARQEAQERKFAASQEQASAAARKRSDTDAMYGAGIGPMAAARAAKSAQRRVERFRRHEANLSAEARDRATWGYGTNIRPDGTGWGQGAAGGMDPTGGMSLDDWFREHPGTPKPTYPFAPPGLLMPPPPMGTPGFDLPPGQQSPYGNQSGGAVTTPSEASTNLKDAAGRMAEAGDAAHAAAEAVDEAGKAVEGTAEKVSDGAGATERLAEAVAGLTDRVGGAFDGLREVAESAVERIDSLEARLVASGYLAG